MDPLVIDIQSKPSSAKKEKSGVSALALALMGLGVTLGLIGTIARGVVSNERRKVQQAATEEFHRAHESTRVFVVGGILFKSKVELPTEIKTRLRDTLEADRRWYGIDIAMKLAGSLMFLTGLIVAHRAYRKAKNKQRTKPKGRSAMIQFLQVAQSLERPTPMAGTDHCEAREDNGITRSSPNARDKADPASFHR